MSFLLINLMLNALAAITKLVIENIKLLANEIKQSKKVRSYAVIIM